MKSKKVLIFIGVLIVLTVLAAVVHLSTREQVPENSIRIITDKKEYVVDITELDYETVSGIRVNGKGEEILVEEDGIALRKLLSKYEIIEFSDVIVFSDDSYSARLTKEEIEEENRVYLLMDEDSLRLVVFGDKNSKRSVSNVVQIEVE